MSLDLALIVFAHVEGAERAYASVREASGPLPWVQELAFVEHHRHDRIVVRGAVAGHYVDVDDRGDVIGKRTTEGAAAGAAAGFFFGPMGLAVGLVAGASAGGLLESEHAEHLHDAFVDELRTEVPVKSSALLVLAAPEHVDTMVTALEAHAARVVRHELSPEALTTLERVMDRYPPVA
jgi:uncharacterized membrane protein